jgi:hypothetical protein
MNTARGLIDGNKQAQVLAPGSTGAPNGVAVGFFMGCSGRPRRGGRRRLVGVYTGGAPLQTLLERLGLEGARSSAEPARSPPRASEKPDRPPSLRRPALGPGVRPRLSLGGVQSPAALGVPPRGPGCQRSFASEPGLARRPGSRLMGGCASRLPLLSTRVAGVTPWTDGTRAALERAFGS